MMKSLLLLSAVLPALIAATGEPMTLAADDLPEEVKNFGVNLLEAKSNNLFARVPMRVSVLTVFDITEHVNAIGPLNSYAYAQQANHIEILCIMLLVLGKFKLHNFGLLFIKASILEASRSKALTFKREAFYDGSFNLTTC